jgi:hypothetical protein
VWYGHSSPPARVDQETSYTPNTDPDQVTSQKSGLQRGIVSTAMLKILKSQHLVVESRRVQEQKQTLVGPLVDYESDGSDD